jgi:signal transduction histidine kinase
LIGDEQGNIIIANQGAQLLIGQSSSVLEGAPLQSLFTEPSWVETINKLSHEDAQDNAAGTVVLNLDGQMIRADITRVPSIAGGMGSLSVMFYPAERVTRQSDIVTSLIHELRTPMTSITGYTELMLGESVGIIGETQRQLLQRVNANIERMSGLLDDLVKVSSIDAGQDVLAPEPVDLVNIIENAIMSLAVQFSERDLNVQMDMPSELPSIQADPDSLYQIVLRLLSNACQCSAPGTDVTVHARLEEYDTQMDGLPDYLFMSVTDTGGGIAPQDQQRVFQRLYRADNPLIEGVGDTGVGLSIAKALVEMQGGRIWAESEAGIGSTFSFILPLSPEDGDGSASRYPSLTPFPALEGELEGGQ